LGGTIKEGKVVSESEQARLGREAKIYYTSYLARSSKRARVFDSQMLGLFNAIETGEGDIDERIERLHATWKSENILSKLIDRAKLDLVWEAMAKNLRGRERAVGDLGALRANWTRVMRIGNKHWGNKDTMATRWSGEVSAKEIESL
jgi:hypothetical protein